MYLLRYLKNRSLVKKENRNNIINCYGKIHLSRIKIKGKDNFIFLDEKTILRKSDISIGNNCMFSYGIEIRNSDSHKILNNSLERINKGKEIIIGDNVWIGTRVMVLKGSHIKNGTVIGACSLVNSLIDEKSLAVGYPAKIIKQNITWER